MIEAWKRERSIKEPKQKRLEPKAEAAKTGCSSLGFRMVQFFFEQLESD
jgi:hypothetical protein